MRRKRRAIRLTPEALQLLGRMDVLRLVLGWFLSFHGMLITAAAMVGTGSGILEMERGIHNQPIAVTKDTIGQVRNGRVVSIVGSLSYAQALEFESLLHNRQLTVSPLANSDGRVFVSERGLPTKAETAAPAVHTFTGRLYVMRHLDDDLDDCKVYLQEQLDHAGILHGDPVYVVARDVIPRFEWWVAVVTVGSAVFSLWILRRWVLAIRCMGDRDLLCRHLRARQRSARAHRDGGSSDSDRLPGADEDRDASEMQGPTTAEWSRHRR